MAVNGVQNARMTESQASQRAERQVTSTVARKYATNQVQKAVAQVRKAGERLRGKEDH
jgi:hypothetical protein